MKEEYNIKKYKPSIMDKQTEKIMLSIMKEEFNKEKKKEKLDKSQDNVLIHKVHRKVRSLKKSEYQNATTSRSTFKENLVKALAILLLLLLLGVFIEGIYVVGYLLSYWASNENSNMHDHEDTGFFQLHGFPSEPNLPDYYPDSYPEYPDIISEPYIPDFTY